MSQSAELRPASLVIFGITGDLANRKLLPALYQLERHSLLPAVFRLLGTTRRQLTVQAVFDQLRQQLGEQCDETVLGRLQAKTDIITMDMTQPDDYIALRQRLDDDEEAVGVCLRRFFYLSVPAQHFSGLVQQLGASGLQHGCRHDGAVDACLLIEKPFGYDTASAEQLIHDLAQHYSEAQLYRVDHYLAKETAQNLLTFRFQNPLFRTAWHAGTVKAVQITAAEAIGIEGRADFYEQTGALRDLIQSHLLQLMALVTMDEPTQLTAEAIHEKKLALLQAVQPVTEAEVDQVAVRGQYEGYGDEVKRPQSFVETYAALRLSIDNDAWRGVPILLRTGKALAEKVIEITLIFTDDSHLSDDNSLTIRIQPNEGIVLSLLAKKPGLTNQTERVQMEFCYNRSFAGASGQSDAYERVLLDALRGDKTLFATSDEVLASWRIIEAVVRRWTKDGDGLQLYRPASWGPVAADELAFAAGSGWLTADLNICPIKLAKED